MNDEREGLQFLLWRGWLWMLVGSLVVSAVTMAIDDLMKED